MRDMTKQVKLTKFLRLPLWVQIFTLTWVAMIAVSLLANVWFRIKETEYLKARFYEQSQRTFNVLSSSAIEAIISEDTPVLQTIVSTISSTSPEIVKIVVYNEQGIVLAQWHDSDTNSSPDHISFSDDIIFEGEKFGEFHLVWDSRPRIDKIEKHVENGRIFLVGVLAILTIIISFIIHFVIVRQIIKINERVLCLADGDLNGKVHLHNAAQELVRLADSVNDLGRELQLRRKIEEELTVSKEHLEQTVLKRTAELQESLDKLKDSQSMLLQKEKLASLGQLSAGIAHEINNPVGFVSCNLTALEKYTKKIRSYVEAVDSLISEANNSELAGECQKLKHREKVDFILSDLTDLVDESKDGIKRIVAIVDNLKAFSRVDEADLKLADINNCLNSTIQIVWNELRYNIKLHKDFGVIPEVMCMPQQINQVFLNLLMNAKQAMPEGGIITIKTWSESESIKISFEDNGSGIPEDKIKNIFDPFFTTKPVGSGTGLGLSICYDIINKHGGEILVHSQFGGGTTFTIVLPIVHAELLKSI